MIWRRVPDEDRPGCAEQVERWGYFRTVSQAEVYGCTWFALCRKEADGEDEGVALLWFTAAPESDALAAHICSDPIERGNLSTPDQMHAVEVIAGLLGADRVYSVLVGAKDLRVEVVKRWLRIRGWREHEYGMCREIGG